MFINRVAAAGTVAIALLVVPAAAVAQPCAYTITSGRSVPGSGGSTRLLVTAQPATCSWTVSMLSSTALLGRTFQPAEGDGYFDVTFGPNCMDPLYCAFAPRLAIVSFVGDGGYTAFPMAVQEPYTYACSYQTSISKTLVPNSGGTRTVRVTTRDLTYPDVPCAWIVTSTAEWLHVPAGTLSGERSFDVVVDVNESAQRRTAAVIVGSVSIDVIQEGTQPIMNVQLGHGVGAETVLYNSTTGRYDVFTLGVDAAGASVRQHIDWYRWEANAKVAPADFDGDGLTDFCIYDPTSRVFVGDFARHAPEAPIFNPGGGVFGPANATPTILDTNGDGRSDVLVYDEVSGEWMLTLGSNIDPPEGVGGIRFMPVANDVWAGGWKILVGRFNRDNRDDLFLYNPDVAGPNAGRWFQVLSRDIGTFEYHDNARFEYIEGDLRWAPGWTIVPGDFDGDGQTELFLYGAGGTGYWFLVDFRAEGPVYFGGLWAPGWEVHAANFNGDSRTDLFLYQKSAGPLQGMWFRALSTGAYDFDYIQGDLRWAGGWRVSIGDLDGDGISDVFLDGRSDGTAAQVLTRDAGASSQYAYDFTWPVADTILLPRRITP